METNLKDSIVEEVVQDLQTRSEIGIKKYNTTLDRKDLTTEDWIQHAYEEALDFSLYLKRLKRDIVSPQNQFDELVRDCINQKHELATKDRIIDNLNKVIVSQEEEIKDLNNIINPCIEPNILESEKELSLVRKRRAWHI